MTHMCFNGMCHCVRIVCQYRVFIPHPVISRYGRLKTVFLLIIIKPIELETSVLHYLFRPFVTIDLNLFRYVKIGFLARLP